MVCGLPVTGVDIWPFIGIGLLLLLAGVIAVAIARRNKTAIIGALAIGLLALGGLTLAPTQSASAADPCPIAVPDTNTIDADVVVDTTSGNVLTNDSSPQGFTLTVTNGGPSIALAHGSLELNADGTYTYTINNALSSVDDLPLGSTLTDQYTYDISDGHGGTASTTLTITINGTEQPPAAPALTNNMLWDNDPDTVTGNVLTGSTDPNPGDSISVLTPGPIAGTYGSVSIANDGTYTYTLNEADPAVSGLAEGAHLTDVINYQIADGRGGTDSSTITITINGPEIIG